MVIDLLFFSCAVLLSLLLSLGRFSIYHLLPRQPSGFGGAAPAPHRVCRGGSALVRTWCPGWSAVLVGAVVSSGIGLLLLHSGGFVGPAMATVAAREGDARECASGHDLMFRSLPGRDCPEPPTPVAAPGGDLRSGGSWRSCPLAVHSLCSSHDATVGDTLGGYGHIANS